MGRRSEKIKTRKTAQERIRTKIFARIGKRITMAVKAGGTDVETNRALADALSAARAANCPKDNVERCIARASSSDMSDFRASSFEMYGHGGIAVYVNVLTDNANRAAAVIRAAAARTDLKVATPGSVAYNFERRAVIRIADQDVDPDQLFEIAVEAGALECEEDDQQDAYRIVATDSDLAIVRDSLTEGGFQVMSSELEMVPNSTVDVSDEHAELNAKAFETLEDLDDVDAVFSNMA